MDLDELELVQVGFLLNIALDVLEAALLSAKRERLVIDDTRKEQIDRKMAFDFRRRQSDRLIDWFSLNMDRNWENDRSWSLSFNSSTLECPVGLWVDLKLSELWRDSVPLQACENCGAVFALSRHGRKYCKHSVCRQPMP